MPVLTADDVLTATSETRGADDDCTEGNREGLSHRSHRDGRAVGHQPRRARRRVRLDHGAVGLRQEHAAQPDGAARRAQRRHGRARRRRRWPATRTARWRGCATARSASSSRRSTWWPTSASSTTSRSRCSTAGCPAASAASWRRPRSTASAWARACTTSRRSSPAASSSASPSPAPSSAARASCWPTSRPATSTARWATRSWRSSKDLQARDKTTVVMVTHDPHLAEQTERIVRLFDGRQVN